MTGHARGRTPVIPPSFAYHRPSSVKDAVGLLAGFGEDGRVLAGGHSLIPMMKLRLARPTALIDINDVAELSYIRVEGAELRIGALRSRVAALNGPRRRHHHIAAQ